MSLSVVDVAAVCGSHDEDGQFRVENVVDDPVVKDSDVPGCLLSDELLRSVGPGVLPQVTADQATEECGSTPVNAVRGALTAEYRGWPRAGPESLPPWGDVTALGSCGVSATAPVDPPAAPSHARRPIPPTSVG